MRIITFVSALFLSSNLAWGEDTFIQEHSYNYNFDSVNVGTDPNSGSLVTIFDSLNLNDINLSISGWSDVERLDEDDKWDYKRVVSAEVQKVFDYGWAVKNSLEGDGSHQTIDNSTGQYPDYDFILLSFSEEVQLDSLNFGWADFGNGSQEVSVAAITDTGFNKLTSENSTWSSIISDAVSSSFSIKSLSHNRGVSNLNFSSTAKYWLVGAYNTVFGTTSSGYTLNDAFKIAGLGFSNTTETKTNTEVSEPGALALMSLGLGLVLYRRKRRV